MKDSKECETQTEETSHMVEEMLVKVKHLEERLATVQQNLVCSFILINQPSLFKDLPVHCIIKYCENYCMTQETTFLWS